VSELKHPGWCDLAHCTATVQKANYRAGETGYHRSAPVTLAHMPNVGFTVFDSELNPVTAHLAQAAPPWDTGALLNLGTADDPTAVSLPIAHAQAVLGQLGGLVAAAGKG
jgi:hypothetical protein